MSGGGEHIPPSPENLTAFVHATALSLKQLLHDTQMYWGPVEWAEYHELMRARLALTPEDYPLIQFCHDVNLALSAARQREMESHRFKV